jgi:mRNA interferase MazF
MISMSPSSQNPKRGEIWDIDLNPTKGQEINKTRPAVVISSDGVGKLRLKIIVPITEWQTSFEGNFWHVQIVNTPVNGLTKVSVADALQTRSLSLERFVKYRGRMTKQELEETVQALAAIVEFS